MSMILTLLLGSAAIGFMIAPRHDAGTVVVSSSILALIAATAAWLGGFRVAGEYRDYVRLRNHQPDGLPTSSVVEHGSCGSASQ